MKVYFCDGCGRQLSRIFVIAASWRMLHCETLWREKWHFDDLCEDCTTKVNDFILQLKIEKQKLEDVYKTKDDSPSPTT